MAAPILDIANLGVTLRTGAKVLSAVDLLIPEGRILGLIGESGAGKSMVGAAVSDTLPDQINVSSGHIRFAGRDLLALTARQRRDLLGRDIGFIPQEPMTALNPSLTIGKQMGVHLARIGIRSPIERRDRTIALFDEVGLRRPAELLANYPHQLSGGMLQRVLIAAAFASDPKLVIADEPTTALDVTIQARVVELIARMRELHRTSVLFVTHDLRLAAEVCDEVSVLYAGRIVENGPAGKVLKDPLHPYSRCLNLAAPLLTGPVSQLYLLPHAMPGVGERSKMEGCEFAPRCPLASDECRTTAPALVVKDGHASACHHVADIARIIDPPPDPNHGKAKCGDTVVLRASGLRKTYNQRDWIGRVKGVEALRGLTFDVREREFVGVVGESGSGKSTLTKLIVGLESVTSGVLEVAGTDMASASQMGRKIAADQVQLVFQDPQSALNPRRTVGSLVTQVLETQGPVPNQSARAAALLAKVKLGPEAANRFPDQLSGGQKQRVNIARALCSNPRLLIADEIVSGLDVSVQAQILELLREMRDEADFSLLLISHDLAVVRHVCDRALVMHQGEIVEQGPVEEVFGNPQHPYTKSLVAAAGGIVS